MRLLIYFVLLSCFTALILGELEYGEGPIVNKDEIACLTNPECEPKGGGNGNNGKSSAGQAAAIAQKAAQEAKAAQDAQQQAGLQASKQVKQQLAEKAMEAAKAAEAALSGKEALVAQLQEELKEAEIVVSTYVCLYVKYRN